MREGHAGLLLLGQRFVVAGDHLPVVVWRAIAAAGAQPILEAPPRRRRDHRRLVAFEGRVHVLAQRFPLRKVLLEGFGALVDARSTRALPATRRRARRRASRARAARATRARACRPCAYSSRSRCASSLVRAGDSALLPRSSPAWRSDRRRAPRACPAGLRRSAASASRIWRSSRSRRSRIARDSSSWRDRSSASAAAAELSDDLVEGPGQLLFGLRRAL